jgi:lipoyl(octanoyl) transferase
LILKQIYSIYLGEITYEMGLEYQRLAKEMVRNGHCQAIFLLLQHRPVITIGMHGGDDHLLVHKEWLAEHHVELAHTNRGGDITCHNPGQLVCYPIIDLKQWKQDVHWYARQVEAALIQTLLHFGIDAGRKAEYTGVWVHNKKIAAIGIGVKNWITYHGTALNVENDLSLFTHIVPCGIREFGVTSMQEEHCSVSVEEVVPYLMQNFVSLFPNDTYTRFMKWSDLSGEKDCGTAKMASATSL